MTARLVGFVLVILVIAAAYAGGYWPEYQRRIALEGEVARLEARLGDAEGRVRAGHLLGRLLNVTDAVTFANYANAQALSSQFFDDVRAEAARTPVADLQSALTAILQQRDTVTAALARGDESAVEILRTLQVRLRQALGYDPVSVQPTTPAD